MGIRCSKCKRIITLCHLDKMVTRNGRIRGFIFDDPFIRYKTIRHTCMGGDNNVYRLTPRTQGNSTDQRSLFFCVLL